MRTTSRYWGVVAIGALAVGVSVYAAPRVDADARSRGKARSDSGRLVTDANDHLRSVVTNEGGIASGAFVELLPINPPTSPAQSYPAGSSLVGNKLTIPGGPQRVWFEMNYGGWKGLLKTVQVTMDGENGFVSGSGDALTRSTPIPCDQFFDDEPHSQCVAAFGPGSSCKSADFVVGACEAGVWQDTARADYAIGGTGISSADSSTDNMRAGSTLGPGQPPLNDTGAKKNAATGALDVPLGASGTYTIGVVDGGTFMTLNNGDQPAFTATPLIIEIPTGSCCFNLSNDPPGCEDDRTATQCADEHAGFVVHSAGKTCAQGCAECTEAGSVQCDDGDACTVESCDLNSLTCARSLKAGFDPNTQCCNGATGAVSSSFDGDPCTLDVCDGSGGCANRDEDSCGASSNPPAPAGAECDDGSGCTFEDVCDDVGACFGTDINTSECTVDEDCGALIEGVVCVDGFCECSESPNTTILIDASDKNDPTCFDADEDKVVATVFVGPSVETITGGQFLIEYDPGCVSLNAVSTIEPFNQVLFQQEGNGWVYVAVGVDFGGSGVVGGNLEMVSVSFTKRGECAACELCLGQNNPFRSSLTNADGQSVTIEGKCSSTITSNGTLTVDTPETMSVNVMCDGVTADVTWATPSAADTCELVGFTCDGEYQNPFTNQVVPVAEIGVDPLTGGTFPIGVTNFCCTAENVCGDVQTDCWTVDVNDETTLDVNLELSPTISTKVGEDITRCIQFELFSNCVQAPAVVESEIAFGGLFNLTGHFADDIKLPAVGKFSCITARDQLHSLRSCYTFEDGDCDSNGVLHAEFKGDPFDGGNWLVQGNLDGWKKDNPDASHDSIDITDFGTFVSQYLQELSPDTPCGTSGPHSDINGDGIVDLLDFTFISMNFLEDSKDCCCPSSTAAGVRGRTAVSVAELRQSGQGDLTVADLNADGMVDMADMEMALRGDIPVGKKTSKRNRTGSGLR